MHGQIARVTGTGVIEVERRARLHDRSRTRRLDTISEHKPIVTFLCSPNNPTGLIERPEFVEQVLATVSDFGLLVVDEAYAQFSDWSALDLFDEDRPLIVTRTFSKTWAMAAARIGYLVAPTWVTERLNTAILPYHLDAVSQAAGSAALDFEDEMNQRVARMVEQRGAIQAGLGELGVEFWPSQSNFILFRPPGGAGDDVWQQLVDRGVLVRNCASWPRLDGCLRVTVGTSRRKPCLPRRIGRHTWLIWHAQLNASARRKRPTSILRSISMAATSTATRAFRSSITCSTNSVATAALGSGCMPRATSRSTPITRSKT